MGWDLVLGLGPRRSLTSAAGQSRIVPAAMAWGDENDGAEEEIPELPAR